MGYYDADVYHQPEKFGLTQVAFIDYSSGNYEFDFRIVWRTSSGLLLTARDAGCSCPSPFETYTDLRELDLVDYDELEAECADKMSGGYAYGPSSLTVADFLRNVRVALRDSVTRSEAEQYIEARVSHLAQ